MPKPDLSDPIVQDPKAELIIPKVMPRPEPLTNQVKKQAALYEQNNHPYRGQVNVAGGLPNSGAKAGNAAAISPSPRVYANYNRVMDELKKRHQPSVPLETDANRIVKELSAKIDNNSKIKQQPALTPSPKKQPQKNLEVSTEVTIAKKEAPVPRPKAPFQLVCTPENTRSKRALDDNINQKKQAAQATMQQQKAAQELHAYLYMATIQLQFVHIELNMASVKYSFTFASIAVQVTTAELHLQQNEKGNMALSIANVRHVSMFAASSASSVSNPAGKISNDNPMTSLMDTLIPFVLP